MPGLIPAITTTQRAVMAVMDTPLTVPIGLPAIQARHNQLPTVSFVSQNTPLPACERIICEVGGLHLPPRRNVYDH